MVTVVLRVGRCFLKLLEVRMHSNSDGRHGLIKIPLYTLYSEGCEFESCKKIILAGYLTIFFYSQINDMMKTAKITLKKILEIGHPKTTFRKSHEETINYLPISHSSRS
jgi:hypothetical protein